MHNNSLNQLEKVAAMFTSGVADGDYGLKTLGLTFCESVRINYDVISMLGRRKNSRHDFYDCIVDLYSAWSVHFTEEELINNMQKMYQDLNRLGGKPLPSISPRV